MTPAEYVELVQETLSFPESGVGHDPKGLLYLRPDQIAALEDLHNTYVRRVAFVLGVEVPTPEVPHPKQYQFVESEGGSLD